MQPTIPSPAELEKMLLERLDLSEKEQATFITPSFELGDPFLFRDMKAAVERINTAVSSGEYVGIYADYDCDGIPAAVILVDLFKKIGVADRVHVYIPDRHDEGYGLNTKGLDELEKAGVTLMLTVDVGITALAEIADAHSRGIDTIVTDHHTVLEMLPAGLVVHPMVGEYPNKDLCGAGVAFMLVRAFVQRYADTYNIQEGWEKWLLDLAAFATFSDMVPLTGENRIIATYGLMVMRKTRRVGLLSLFAANSISPERLVESDLTFTVAPRLNAASRMDTPMLAFNLLATDDKLEAAAIVKRLEEINTERKTLVATITKAAIADVGSRELPGIVVIGNPNWRPAVLGLVANKLVEKFNRSFFVWGEAGDGILKGSCRMLPEHHAGLLFQALPEETLLHSGGHQAAGGFAVTREKVHFLETALNTGAEKMEAIATDEEAVQQPLTLPLAVATIRHYGVIRKLAPFGVGNGEPEFLFENILVTSSKKFGKAKDHIECELEDATCRATAFTFFATDEMTEALKERNTISFLGTLEPGWRGGVRIRIRSVL